jgi:hypothetical protein
MRSSLQKQTHCLKTDLIYYWIEPVGTEQISVAEISTEQQGFEIMQEMDKRDMGWG